MEEDGQANSGDAPPEFLSTHPAEDNRAKTIQSLLPTVMPLLSSRIGSRRRLVDQFLALYDVVLYGATGFTGSQAAEYFDDRVGQPAAVGDRRPQRR